MIYKKKKKKDIDIKINAVNEKIKHNINMRKNDHKY